MGLGGAEQHPVGHDDRAPPAHFEHPKKEGQEQQLGFLGLTHLQQVGGHDVRVQTPLEGGISQNEGVLLPVDVLVAEAVPILNVGVVDAVGHHVHGPDAQHGAVHVVAMEHVVHVVVLLHPVVEDLLFAVLLQVLPRRHQEAAGTAGRVADHIIRPGGHHVHHHADDVPGGAELAVNPGGGDFGQEVFVDVAPDIGVVDLLRLGVDLVHGGDDLVQHQRRGDLENGVPHVLGVGAVLVGVEVLDEGEHPLLHDGIHLSGGKIVEH